MFGGNDGLLRFIIGNPKYPQGLGGLDLLPPRSNGCLAKILSTFMGIFVCMLTRFVSLKVYGLDLILRMVWDSVVVNGTSVNVTIEWGIAT
jgi:hypothetical protein